VPSPWNLVAELVLGVLENPADVIEAPLVWLPSHCPRASSDGPEDALDELRSAVATEDVEPWRDGSSITDRLRGLMKEPWTADHVAS
jgi:hypothetical protein